MPVRYFCDACNKEVENEHRFVIEWKAEADGECRELNEHTIVCSECREKFVDFTEKLQEHKE